MKLKGYIDVTVKEGGFDKDILINVALICSLKADGDKCIISTAGATYIAEEDCDYVITCIEEAIEELKDE